MVQSRICPEPDQEQVIEDFRLIYDVMLPRNSGGSLYNKFLQQLQSEKYMGYYCHSCVPIHIGSRNLFRLLLIHLLNNY